MEIKFQVDPDRLTLNDLIELEDGAASPRFQRDFLARFVLNGDGYMEENEAKELIGNLSLADLVKTMEQFSEAIEELQETAIPKVSD